jgi:hypothetical protein
LADNEIVELSSMRRFLRYSFTAASVLSQVAGLALVVVWLVAPKPVPFAPGTKEATLWVSTDWFVSVDWRWLPTRINFGVTENLQPSCPPGPLSCASHNWNVKGINYLYVCNSDRNSTWSLAIHLFYLVALTSLLPLAWTATRVMRHLAHRRLSSGSCQTCGYDLQASGGSCPECGTPIPSKPPAC